MACKECDLQINAGADYKLSITVEDVDLTGFTMRSQFRRTIKSSTVDLELTNANSGFVVTDAASGMFQMIITNVQTSALSGRYVYDVEIVSSGDEVTRILCGNVVVSPEVTR